MFTARYGLSPYIKQTRLVFKGLIHEVCNLLMYGKFCYLIFLACLIRLIYVYIRNLPNAYYSNFVRTFCLFDIILEWLKGF